MFGFSPSTESLFKFVLTLALYSVILYFILHKIVNFTVKQRFTIERNQSVEKQLVLDELAYKVDIPAAAIHDDDVGKWI